MKNGSVDFFSSFFEKDFRFFRAVILTQIWWWQFAIIGKRNPHDGQRWVHRLSLGINVSETKDVKEATAAWRLGASCPLKFDDL